MWRRNGARGITDVIPTDVGITGHCWKGPEGR